jgi:hypothetical protein
MNKLTLFITALFLTSISFSQVPANDLIENAIEINPSNYVEENLRLDLATTTGEEPIDCETGTFTKVYYKFTATANGSVSVVLSDMISNPITQSYVIAYTSPNLNQIDVSQLNVVTGLCVLGTYATFPVTTGFAYYIVVHRLDANAFSKITFSFGMPPVNGSIENAIEMTGSNFNDLNGPLRLDLAAANPGGQIGCDLTGFNTVYYKFTANTNGNATFFLYDDEPGSPPSDGFVRIYTAANLNATSDSELTINLNCDFQVQPTIGISSGQSYYVLVYRGGTGEQSTFGASISQDGPPSERQALIDFYTATDGPNWGLNANWNTSAPLSEWVGIALEGGHVISMGLGNVGVKGNLPSSILNLPFLEIFNFSNNELTGEIPDMTVLTSLETFNVLLNKFTFGNLEANFVINSTLPNFVYLSQKGIDPELQITPQIGSNYTLFVTPDTGTNISYQWFKKRASVDQNILITGATNATYSLTNIQTDDLDNYICVITSSTIPDLIITREPINLTGPVSQQERDALIAFYNALDGDNWSDNANWLSTEPVGNWSFITTRGNKVIKINIFNTSSLNGELPTEIGDLIHLEVLSIGVEQNLTGPIPASIGNLSQLQKFRFQGTSNSGSVPASIGNLLNLREIRIIGTALEGELLSNLGNLTNLTDLYIPGAVFFGNGNNFTGEIPESIGNLTNLTRFQIAENSFEGQLPSTLSNLINLTGLFVSDNNLSGPIPDLTGFTNLESVGIALDNNYFNFSNLEPLVNNGVTYGFLSYSPQRTLDEEIQIESLPGVDITLEVDATDIERDSNDTAIDNEFQWYKNEVVISGADSSTYVILNAQETDSGVYYCEITNTTLPDLVIIRANITVLIDENLNAEDFEINDFVVFPNPATNWISVKTKSGTNALAQVFNISGKLILKKELTYEITAISIEWLAAGVYILKVSNDKMQSTQRFIKQ